MEHWDDIWRRNQFFADRMQEDYDVTYIGPTLPITQIIKKKIRFFKNIKCRYVYKMIPERLGSIALILNSLFYFFQVIFIAGIKTDILWVNDHTKYLICRELKHAKLVYDITDDWTLINYPQKEKEQVIHADKKLSMAADNIIVCSDNLLVKKKQYGEKTVLIKNGINIADYQSDNQSNSLGEYFLYTGSLHEERLNIELVIALATTFPEETFKYVGPVYFCNGTKIKLSKYKNIILTGAKPYQEMSMIMNQAKALLVPHLQTDFVNSLDPIKQYEYMLSTKPVVAINVSGFKDWGNIYTIVNSADEFKLAVQRVLAGSTKVDSLLRAEMAKKSTWDSRYQDVKKILKS